MFYFQRVERDISTGRLAKVCSGFGWRWKRRFKNESFEPPRPHRTLHRRGQRRSWPLRLQKSFRSHRLPGLIQGEGKKTFQTLEAKSWSNAHLRKCFADHASDGISRSGKQFLLLLPVLQLTPRLLNRRWEPQNRIYSFWSRWWGVWCGYHMIPASRCKFRGAEVW